MKVKEKIIGRLGSLSGAASVLGSWQVCHNVCLGIIALLAMVGITVMGMPLLFLTKIALPMWILAVVMLLIITVLYYSKKCFSRNLLLFNLGLIIAGIPFSALATAQYFFLSIGGALAAAGLLLYLREKKWGGNFDRKYFVGNFVNWELVVIILAVLLGIFVIGSYLNSTVLSDVAKENTADSRMAKKDNTRYSTITTGTTETGDVEISLTPSWQGQQLVIDVAFNTHSVDLGPFDLSQITMLKYNKKEIKPTEASSLSGHHGSGKIIFQLNAFPKTFTLIIEGIPAVQKRIYNW